MNESIYIILGILGYVLACWLIPKFIRKLIPNEKIYLRLLVLSFIYALFYGIGIAGSDGHPGFAFPVPNIIALYLMYDIGFYSGMVIGFYILLFWWVTILSFMLIRQLLRKKKNGQVQPT
jgi:hypothetical protein